MSSLGYACPACHRCQHLVVETGCWQPAYSVVEKGESLSGWLCPGRLLWSEGDGGLDFDLRGSRYVMGPDTQ
ncbi:hypothetical protein ES703_71099 [subsurface metagenome]